MIDKEYDQQEHPDRISEVGNDIIQNMKEGNENNTYAICAKCMYDMYMSKGIFPQTKQDQSKGRSHSENRNMQTLPSNDELQRKLEKEAIIAKHVSPAIAMSGMSTMSNFKPTMLPKQKLLSSNFAEYSGATIRGTSKYY